MAEAYVSSGDSSHPLAYLVYYDATEQRHGCKRPSKFRRGIYAG